MILLRSILILVCTIKSLALLADVAIHIGPVAGGGGGPNPASIPPINPLDYEVVWLTAAKSEFTFGVIPGLFYGKRLTFTNGTYFSSGLGAVIDFNGVGPGAYAAMGYETCGLLCFNIEYKKAFGISSSGLIQPYAIRAGIVLFKQ